MACERFLRARGYNVPVAAALFLEHRKWRMGFNWSVSPSSARLPASLA